VLERVNLWPDTLGTIYVTRLGLKLPLTTNGLFPCLATCVKTKSLSQLVWRIVLLADCENPRKRAKNCQSWNAKEFKSYYLFCYLSSSNCPGFYTCVLVTKCFVRSFYFASSNLACYTNCAITKIQHLRKRSEIHSNVKSTLTLAY
jgi:hypothetical protein